jgi:hypothetical protein
MAKAGTRPESRPVRTKTAHRFRRNFQPARFVGPGRHAGRRGTGASRMWKWPSLNLMICCAPLDASSRRFLASCSGDNATSVMVEKAQQQIAKRCRELGIPERFAPSLDLDWRHRGYDNMVAKRKTELRHMAETRVAAIEAKAITEIEMGCPRRGAAGWSARTPARGKSPARAGFRPRC